MTSWMSGGATFLQQVYCYNIIILLAEVSGKWWEDRWKGGLLRLFPTCLVTSVFGIP